MRDSNTLLYIVLAIVILHFIVGIGYLVYKLVGPIKKDNIENSEKKEI